jgi:hypothetical protein
MEIKIKSLLSGAAMAAVLAITAPTWAQNPSGGNGMGMPGPNPGGGGGLTPYSTGAPPAPATAAAPPASTSGVPPMHHAQRHAKAMHAFHKRMAHKAALTGDTTAQLNREELARIQQGAPPSPPPPAPAPAPASQENPSGGNSMGMAGPSTGGPGLTPYSGGGGTQR